MKKFNKFLLIVLSCLTLATSSYKVRDFAPSENENSFETLANYNELYGIKSLEAPQLVLNKANEQNLKYLAVFIEFSDSDDLVTNHLDDKQSVENANKLLNSDELFDMNTVTGTIKVPSFKKYYEMQSYGKLHIATEIFPKENGEVISYKAPQPMDYYRKYSSTNPIGYQTNEESLKRETELVDGAIAFVSDQIKAFGIKDYEIDTGGDGIVDAISFFIEGRDVLSTPISWGELLWSHKLDNYGLSSTILGKRVVTYNLLYTYDYTTTAGLFSLDKGTYGTIMHEYGHTLGYRDLYRHDHSGSQPVGFYDIMGSTSGSNPQNLLSYFITEYSTETSWHKPLPVISSTTKNITVSKPQFQDDSEKRAVKIMTSSSKDEFFVVEYHEKQNTYSNYSADSSGIIVYRVNEKNKYSGCVDGGDHGENDHIFVFRPNEPSLGSGRGDLEKATLNMNRTTLGKNSITSSDVFDNETIYYSNGQNSGITVTVTSETADSVTFDVTFPELEGSGTSSDPYLIRDTDTFIYMMKTNSENKYYELVDDLDFKDVVDYPKIEFSGNLDGKNHTIKNVTSKTGVFSSIESHTGRASVKNIFVENITVSSNTGFYLGGFVSTTTNATIENVHLRSGSVTNVESSFGNTLDSTGGFVGNASTNTIIKNCTSALDVTSPQNAGGFVGINMNATIENCFATGRVSSTGVYGAFIGVQCIMDYPYKVPLNAYFYEEANPDMQPVGGFAALHIDGTLAESNISIGITGISIPKDLTVLKSAQVDFEIKTTSNVEVAHNISVEDPSLASYSSGHILGLASGITKAITSFSIGDETINIETKILVRDEDSPVTEVDALNYLNLSKKEDYLVGFALEQPIASVRTLLMSYPKVDLIGLKDSYGNEVTAGTIATNMKIDLLIDGTEYHYTVVVKGDVNGDGLIYATDYVKIKNHIMGRANLQGAYLLAADIDNDGNIFAIDYVRIKNYIMGKGTIKQHF